VCKNSKTKTKLTHLVHKSSKYNLVSYNDSSTISPFCHYHTSTTCKLTTITNMYREQSTISNTPIINDTDDTTSTIPTQSPVRAVEKTFSPTEDTEMTMSPNIISSSTALQSLSILSINMMILTTIMV
jgi:hypothetical protein